MLPVLRWSGPDEDAREAAVRYWKRAIQITVDLGVSTMNTEFSGRPEKAEESERAFYRSMEELLPIIEREGIDLLIDPHPDDFVEEGLAAIRVIRGLNSKNVGLVYVASHSFHMKNAPLEIMRAAGDKLRLVHVADTMDHHASHGLRYITNPPGNPVRVHQHLKIGDGDVNWDEFFGGLQEIGFLDREDTVMVSSVFAEDDNAAEVSRYQLETMKQRHRKSAVRPPYAENGAPSPTLDTAAADRKRPPSGPRRSRCSPLSADCSSATTPASSTALCRTCSVTSASHH